MLAVRQARVRFSARHHREVFPHWADKRWGNGERPQRMAMDKCIVCMWLNEWMYVCMLRNMKNKQKEWHPATKPFNFLLARTSALGKVVGMRGGGQSHKIPRLNSQKTPFILEPRTNRNSKTVFLDETQFFLLLNIYLHNFINYLNIFSLKFNYGTLCVICDCACSKTIASMHSLWVY